MRSQFESPVRALVAGALLVAIAISQSQSFAQANDVAAFEVASIKPDNDPGAVPPTF